MSDVLATLRAVRELLADPAKWTQGCFARDCCGERVDWDADEAVCFCLMGASRRVADPEQRPHDYRTLRARLSDALDIGETQDDLMTQIVEWNDAPERTHAEVLALLDRAIAEEERADG